MRRIREHQAVLPSGVCPTPCRRAFSSLGDFFLARRGGVAIETALAISILVLILGGLTAIAHAAYAGDRMDRAARAAARAIALAPDRSDLNAVACDAIRRELDLDAGFDCSASWTIIVETDLSPASLAGGTDTESGEGGGDAAGGDIVMVRIEWSQGPWAAVGFLLEGSASRIASALARSEPDGAPATSPDMGG